MTRNASIVVLVFLCAATIACDRVTKHVAATHLAGAPARSFLADTVRIEYVENPGAFLGLGSEWPSAVRTLVFTVGSGLLLIALVVGAVHQRWSRSALAGVALLAAGGISNLVDRAVGGRVVDFMNVGVGPVRTGIFNVADVAVMAGTLVVVAKLLAGRRSA
jgi:signal peptidase II